MDKEFINNLKAKNKPQELTVMSKEEILMLLSLEDDRGRNWKISKRTGIYDRFMIYNEDKAIC